MFSGEGQKGESSYAQWRSELDNVCDLYQEAMVLSNIRRSLRGRAADVLLAMGSDVSVEQVLAEFDVRFGDVRPCDRTLEQFFSARQLPTESVSVWGCRLEELLSQVRDPDGVAAAKSMLKSRYWSGLYSDQIRNALRHHFDEGADFEALLRQARIAEQEPCNSTTNQSLLGQNQDKFDTIMQQLIGLNSKVKELEAEMSETGRLLTNQNPDSIVCAPASTTLSPVKPQPQDFETTKPQQFPGRCYACGQTGHKRGSPECSKMGSGKGLRPVDGAKPGVGLEGLNSGGGRPKNPDIEVVRASSAKIDSITSSVDPDIERDVHSPVVDEPGVIGLVGPSCEVTVTLEDTSCQALLDKGSMVSTVTYSLAHKLKLDIHPMDHLLRVEGVGGQMLQYLGYVLTQCNLNGMLHPPAKSYDIWSAWNMLGATCSSNWICAWQSMARYRSVSGIYM